MALEQLPEVTRVITELLLKVVTMPEMLVLEVPTELVLVLEEPKEAMEPLELQVVTERQAVTALVAETAVHLKPRSKSNQIRKMDNSSTRQTLQITRKCSSVVSPSRQLPVINYSKSTCHLLLASLRAHFEQFGAVKDVEIKSDPTTGLSRGFGFVLFELPESVNAVMEAGQQFLDGKRIDPKPAEKRNCKIFIGGISPSTTSEVVQELMETFGQVDNFER